MAKILVTGSAGFIGGPNIFGANPAATPLESTGTANKVGANTVTAIPSIAASRLGLLVLRK